MDNQTNENASKELLTIEEVYDVLKFAQFAYGGGWGGAYTPELINARLKDVSLSPQAATSAKIDAALAAPKENEQQLVGYSEYMELVSMLYKRILLYFSGLLSFDLNYVCTNISEESDYSSAKYKKDLAIVEDFFNRFDIKREFRIVLKQMLRQEVFYGILRDEGETYTLQELPQQFSKLTGRWENGLLFDFNMLWFWQAGVDISMYPSVFKKMYAKAYDNMQKKGYNPSLPIDARSGSWAYWVQTSPKDGFVAFKLFPEIATVIPFLSPLMGDTILQPVIRELQKNSYIAEASKIIFGQVEFLKDATSKVKDALTISPDTLGKFIALMKAGLPDAIKVAAAPLANTTGIEFGGSNEIYDSYLKSAASVSGINSRLLYSFDRQNVLETQLSLDVDQNILRPVYNHLESMLNYWVNKRTKKYKFKFLLEGFNTKTDRDSRLETAKKLAEIGIVLEQKFSSALGVTPFEFRSMLAETRSNDFVKKLTPIVLASQMPKEISGANGGGRPEKSENDLGDSGANTRSGGSNLEKTES